MKLHSSAVLGLWLHNRQRPGSMGVMTALQSAILKWDSMSTQYWYWEIVRECFWWLQSILMPRISVVGPRLCSLKCLVRLAMACLIASRNFDAKVISSKRQAGWSGHHPKWKYRQQHQNMSIWSPRTQEWCTSCDSTWFRLVWCYTVLSSANTLSACNLPLQTPLGAPCRHHSPFCHWDMHLRHQ